MDSSSDSEDDCYGNIAQKLQSMKNKYTEDKIDTTNLLNDSAEAEVDEIVKKAISSSKTNEKAASESQQNNDTSASCNNEENLIDTLVASSSKRVTRSAVKRSFVDASLETAPKKTTKKKAKTDTPNENAPDKSVEEAESNNTTLESNNTTQGTNSTTQGSNNTTQESNSTQSSSRGRSRGRNRGRGRAKNRNRNLRMWLPVNPFERALILSAYPTYSVGNTDEYPDQSDNQALFSTKPATKSDDVVILEENDIDENEELSVKVYWQSSEFFKFTIRRYQKLTQIFDYFAKKEGVSNDKLLFTFNDKILKADDTPDSIDYSIVKFIDGGIVSQSVSQLVTDKHEDKRDGIKLKFQCQNVKKPFETIIGLDEKLSITMMKCAEHYDTTLDKLKFEFDGDSISGKHTPRDLELEGGECIDVRITS